MKIPQIKPHFRVEVIEPRYVYLLAENGTHALTGELYCQIIPLLDGNHTIDDIISKLAGIVEPEHIHYVIERLEARGYLSETVPSLTPEAAAFWSLVNVEPQVAYQCLQPTQIYLTCVGNVSPQPLITSLGELGIKTQEWSSKSTEFNSYSLLVVLTDDYLQPELSKINQIALEANQPWLLVKPVGGLLWLGPIFEPGKTGCWQCLAHRLQGNREVEASILRQKQKSHPTPEEIPGCLPLSRAVLPSTLKTALHLTTTEIAKWIVKQSVEETSNFSTLEGKIITFDQTHLNLESHILLKRPQCPACGNPQLLSERGYQPVTLSNRKKHFTSDGGHRALSPDQTVKDYQHLISPITGVVTSLVRTSDPNNPLVHTYSAVHSFGASSSLKHLRRSLRHKSGGKGKTDRQSKASGFCEAVERYSGVFQGDEPRISSTLAELGEKAIDPRQCFHFSPSQYENRKELNANIKVAHDWIPQPFDETQTLDWTPVWSLTEQTHKYLPVAWCYYSYPLPKGHKFCFADSNGNAAGNTLEEAILQGFMELVERDSVGIWWYNRLSRPGVDLNSFDEPYLLQLQDFYQRNQRELWVLDLTTDLGIPAFVALSRHTGGEYEKIITGYGAHFDPKIAILRAVTEVNQLGLGVDEIDITQSDAEWKEWMMSATLANQPYLVPDSQIKPKVYGDYQQLWSDDIYQDVLTCVDIAKQAGYETLVLNQTRPDIDLKVVKVIVPELRHFWSRFGAGRLYDVPVKMGWLSAPLPEEKMNPMPMVF